MKKIQNLIRKVVANVKRRFAMRIIRKYTEVFNKYTEGQTSAMVCFAEIYKTLPGHKEYVKQLYKDIAEKELQLTVDLKAVKKGGEKYFVIICKDRKLQTVFSLKRHCKDGEITDVKPSSTKTVNF